MHLRMFMSLGVIAIVVAVMAFSAPAEEEASPVLQKRAVPMAPMEEPEAMPMMQKPPVPQPDRGDGADIDDSKFDAVARPQDGMDEPEAVPMMQRPQPPAPQKEPDDVMTEGRVLTLVVTRSSALAPGEEAVMTFHFTDQEGKDVAAAALAENGGHKAHFYIIDESLKDFSHLHAQAVDPAGRFSVAFTPDTPHNYVVYADVAPVGGERQIVFTRLQGQSPCEGDCTDRAANGEAEADGIRGVVAFEAPPLRQGAPQQARLILTGKDAKPLGGIEPVAGSFAHVTAFYEGFGGMVYGQVGGEAPADETSRAASPLSFTLGPDAPGYLKYFVELRVDGKDVVLPFGITVEP